MPWALGILALAVVAFFLGYFMARGPVGELRAHVEAAEARTEAAEERADLAVSRAALMEALSLDYRAVLDLDARNFGTANDHLQNSASVLADVDTSLIDGAGVASLRRRMEATDVNVALDLQQQREKLLGFARELQGLIPDRVMPSADSVDVQ